MKKNNLISEITRMKQMMGVSLLNEQASEAIEKVWEKMIGGGEKALEAGVEKDLAASIEKSVESTLEKAKNMDTELSKALKAKGITTAEELFDKGATLDLATQNELKNLVFKEAESLFPAEFEQASLEAFKKTPEFMRVKGNIYDVVTSDASKEEKVGFLNQMKQDFLNDETLTQAQKNAQVTQIDNAIGQVEKSTQVVGGEALAGGTEKSVEEILTSNPEQTQKFAEDIANAFETKEQIFNPDLKKLKALAEKNGWPKGEIDKFIKAFVKNAPKTEEEFAKRATEYVLDNKDRIAQELAKEGLEKEARELTKFTPSQGLEYVRTGLNNLWNKWGLVGKAAYVLLMMEVIGLVGGVNMFKGVWNRFTNKDEGSSTNTGGGSSTNTGGGTTTGGNQPVTVDEVKTFLKGKGWTDAQINSQYVKLTQVDANTVKGEFQVKGQMTTTTYTKTGGTINDK
jgi:hypothetical protein